MILRGRKAIWCHILSDFPCQFLEISFSTTTYQTSTKLCSCNIICLNNLQKSLRSIGPVFIEKVYKMLPLKVNTPKIELHNYSIIDLSLAMNAKSHHSVWVMKFWPPWNCKFFLQKHPPMQQVFTTEISTTKINSIHLFVFSSARSLFRSRDFRRLLPPRFFPCDVGHNIIAISTFSISNYSEPFEPSLFWSFSSLLGFCFDCRCRQNVLVTCHISSFSIIPSYSKI